MGTTLKHPQRTGLMLREGFESARAKSFARANNKIMGNKRKSNNG